MQGGAPTAPPAPGMGPPQPSSSSKKRRWYLGIQSKKDPAHVMTEVYKALMQVRPFSLCNAARALNVIVLPLLLGSWTATGRSCRATASSAGGDRTRWRLLMGWAG
jgi:hypothetical protein